MGRLVLNRADGEAVVIRVPGQQPIRITVRRRSASYAALEIEAERSVAVDREEIAIAKQQQ